ncbi:MAG: metal-dependent transcriptional regulator [Actinomycetota bacterium]|nr:MAG: metal-dependent transcriptional regulator [Actinomycetota bacterium]
MSRVRSFTVDRYLETIYCIASEGETVRPNRIAYWLAVSAPTVSEALQRLERDGWITIAADRSITLTATGLKVATALVRRHRILERWLADGRARF